MKILPLNPTENASPEALLGFLSQCQAACRSDHRSRLASISIVVDALDPLAVLEAIYEPGHPHFYAEHPSSGTAIAGAEVAMALTAAGPDRFARLQDFADRTFATTMAVGTVTAPFGGPHVFVAATFADEVEPDEPFPPVSAFVPRWQVARAGEVTTAVANVPVTADSDLPELAARLLRAHGRFRGTRCWSEAVVEPAGSPSEIRRGESPDYRTSVAAALDRIAAGEFAKIVLARAIDLQAPTPLHPLEALNGLRQRFPDCCSFSVANGAGDSFIGASPERLVQVTQDVLKTDVLAGTIQRGRGAVADAAMGSALQESAKDRHEHAVVLASVVRRLRSLGLSPDHPPRPRLRKLANLQHLFTPVRAPLSPGIRLLDALAVLHPTPAVGGSPRASAIRAIRDLEGFPRGLYAGAIGWINHQDEGEFMVGIRSALVREHAARIYAGAGIVAGSIPDREFAETDLKFRALLEGLRPAL